MTDPTGATLPGVEGTVVRGDYVVSVDSSMVDETIPANTVPTKIDAQNRAWRTFAQNWPLDLLVIIGPLLVDALTSADFAFTWAYWVPVMVSVAKTGLLSFIAYWMRLKKPPVGATQ